MRNIGFRGFQLYQLRYVVEQASRYTVSSSSLSYNTTLMSMFAS